MKVRFTLLLGAIFALAACQPRSESIAEKLKKQSEEIQRNTEKQIEDLKRENEEMKARETAGGSPATVYLSKLLVKDSSSSQIKPIDQIKIQLLGGVGKSGKRADISGLKLVQLYDSQTPVATELKPQNTYISLGCENLPPADIAGFKEVKAKIQRETYQGNEIDTFYLNATRVFVCGQRASKNRRAVIVANEFAMSDASVELKDSALELVIRANTLILRGKNKFIHKARNSKNALLQPLTTISISAEEKLHGDGELEIVSEGPSFESSETPKASTEPKKDDKKPETTAK